MKTDRKFLLGLLALIILLSCTRDPQQIPAETSMPAAVLESEKIRDSTLPVLSRRGDSRSVGSGFFVGPNKIATNIHVVAGADPISAHVKDNGTIWSIQGVTAFDVKNDLVILKISGKGVPLPLSDSDTVDIGDPIAVAGYPGGNYKVEEGTIQGIQNSDKWFKMKVNTYGGNSGGPVLNRKGHVIGVYAASELSYSYAIPSNALRTLLARSGPTEPLKEWQKQKLIRAYAYAVHGLKKLKEADYDGAIAELDKAIQLDLNLMAVYHNRGVVKSLLGMREEERGSVTGANQHYQDAIDDYTEAIIRNPEYAIAYDNRGIARYRVGRFKADRGDVIEAQEYYQDAIDDHTDAIRLKMQFTQVYTNRARATQRLAQSKATEGYTEEARNLYKAAIADRTNAIQFEPKNAKNYNGRGWAKSHMGQFEDEAGHASEAQRLYQAAIDDYTQAIQLDSEHAYAYNNRGRAKHFIAESKAAAGNIEEARKLYEAAITDVDKSIQLDSDNADAYRNRGATKAALGDFEGAIVDFDKAIEIDPEDAEAYYSRGLANKALNRKEAAESDFEKAKDLDPNVGK